MNIQGISLSPAQAAEVSRKIAQAKGEQSYLYPWKFLERDLNRRGFSSISIVGYGSLLNSTSAGEILHDTPLGPRQPVIAFGTHRIFNYQMSPDGGRYGPPTKVLARAALNTRITGDINDAVNGVLLEIPVGDIPAIRKREFGYDLIPVACLGWNTLEKAPFLAYILRCPDKPRRGKKLTNDRLEPHREYYRVCRRGAAELGEEFLRFWLSTTYLADGITSMGQWEASEFPEMGAGRMSGRKS